MKKKGHWKKGHRRNVIDASQFISSILSDDEYSARGVASTAGFSDKTIRRWAAGKNFASVSDIEQLIDSLWPVNKRYPQLSKHANDVVLGPDSRVLGVGDYSRRASIGRLHCD